MQNVAGLLWRHGLGFSGFRGFRMKDSDLGFRGLHVGYCPHAVRDG